MDALSCSLPSSFGLDCAGLFESPLEVAVFGGGGGIAASDFGMFSGGVATDDVGGDAVAVGVGASALSQPAKTNASAAGTMSRIGCMMSSLSEKWIVQTYCSGLILECKPMIKKRKSREADCMFYLRDARNFYMA